jgi:hypothetical protein
MKKILILIITLSAINASAQLVVNESPKDSMIWQASKLYTVPKIIKMGDRYVIYYRNAKYTHITDVDYIVTGDRETSVQFYELCKSVIKDDKEFNLELDGKRIILKKGTMGTVMVWTDGSFFYLSEKYINAILQRI